METQESKPVGLPRMTAKRIVYKIFTKKFSLSLKVDSSKFLEDQICQQKLTKDEAETWLNAIAETWIQLEANKPLVELEPLKSTIKMLDLKQNTEVMVSDTLNGDKDTAGGINLKDYFHVIDAFDVPAWWYDTSTRQFKEPFETLDILSGPEAKSALFCQRYEVVKQRILHNDNFMVTTLRGRDSNGNITSGNAIKIDTIESLQGRDEESFILFGMLSQLEEGKMFLEDKDRNVELDLTQVLQNNDATGLFTETCLVLVDGYYKDGVFVVEELGLPPPEKKSKTKFFFPDVNFFGGPVQSTLKSLEVSDESARIVVLAEIISALKALFSEYTSHKVPITFVFFGSFCSEPFVLGGNKTQEYKKLWTDFGEMVAQYPYIATSCQFVFVPGPNDHWSSGAYPSPSISEFFTEKARSKIKNAYFTTNPCRLRYFTQEIVIFRENLLKKLHRNCLIPPSSQEGTTMVKHLIRTLIDQGHLCPLPAHIQPIYWAYDHAMRLYPVPDVLILAENIDAYSINYEDCHCINPGSFAESSFGFFTYYPAKKTSQFRQDMLTDYEKKRLENIRKNEEILKELELKKNPKKQIARKRVKNEEEEDSGSNSTAKKIKHEDSPRPVAQRRKSRRLQGMKAEMAPQRMQDEDKDDGSQQQQGSKIKHEESDEDDKDKTKIFRQLRDGGELKLEKIIAKGTFDGFQTAMSDVLDSKRIKEERSNGEENNANKAVESKSTEGLREAFGNLTIRQTFGEPPAVTPYRTYDLAVHPSKTSLLVGAGDKEGTLGFWRIPEDEWNQAVQEKNGPKPEAASEEDVVLPDTFRFAAHGGTISCVSFSPLNPEHFFSASYDGMIKKLDLGQAGIFTDILQYDEEPVINSFSIDGSGSSLTFLFSCHNGVVGRHDIRTKSSDYDLWPLHGAKVGCVDVNPAKPCYFTTSSLDRTTRIWDVRKIAPIEPDDMPIPAEVWHRDESKSVTSSYFHHGGKKLLTTSFDHNVRVFDFDTEKGLETGTVGSLIQIPHNVKTGRWVTMFRATWNPNPSYAPCFVVGNKDRLADIYCGTSGELVGRLCDHDALPTIPAVNKFHPHLPIVVSANASGRVVVWS
ncbi:DNA-directed DNA polymerase epsilon, subunit B [Mycoemilia scoparia]|uniref:DNA polymerase epsilon subunit B n=1 Tax=Mycoemilia scoparia TaxID=417184 RepID=A0A9W7ZYE0_9FUNG|nr:DNA-directed DNA polymerase epsilon, subunit B [Mycoemilia scoparia]